MKIHVTQEGHKYRARIEGANWWAIRDSAKEAVGAVVWLASTRIGQWLETGGTITIDIPSIPGEDVLIV